MRTFIAGASGAPAGGAALRRHRRGIRPDHARRERCGAGSVQRTGQRNCWIISTATASSPATGWRASAARCRKRRAICPKAADCASWKSARAPADWPRSCCRCSSAECTPTLSPMSPPASSPAATRNSRRSPRWNTRSSISKNRAPNRALSRHVRLHRRHQRAARRGRCARHAGTCSTNCWRRAERLMFMDVATPQLWTESVFGLTSGWWHLTDRDLRPEHPLLQRAQWESALQRKRLRRDRLAPGPARLRRRRRPDRRPRPQGRRRTASRPEPHALETPAETFLDHFRRRVRPGRTNSPRRLTCRRRALPRGAPRQEIRGQEADGFTIRADEPEDWKQLFAAVRGGRAAGALRLLAGPSTSKPEAAMRTR